MPRNRRPADNESVQQPSPTERPQVVVVSGPPGSGKSTLAVRLAVELGCPLVSRDAIKEGMVLRRPAFSATQDDPLNHRTYAVFAEMLTLLLDREVSVVAEAAFQHRLWTPLLDPIRGRALIRVIRCTTTAATAQHRITGRGGQRTRRAHLDSDAMRLVDSFVPIQIGAPTLDVDTTDGYAPAWAEILDFCRAT